MTLKLTLLSSLAAASFGAPLISGAQSFSSVQSESTAKLEGAITELAELQESIAAEKVPMATKLNGLEVEVENLRDEQKRLERLRDARDLNLSALEAEVKARRDEFDYAKNLLIEFITNQSASSDASERQLYEEQWLELLNTADVPVESDEAAVASIKSLLQGVDTGIDRLETLVGGHSFEGNAVLSDGSFGSGKFLLYGPVAFFSSSDGTDAGITQQGDSGEPTLISLSDSFGEMSSGVLAGGGTLPLDPTLGKALALETTKESLIEHIQKGGYWVYPIIAVAVISLLIALIKLIELFGIKQIPKTVLIKVISEVQSGETAKALELCKKLPTHSKELLEAGIKNIKYSEEVIEQSMEEVLMRTQPKLDRLLSLIWITASIAPLLGLLGTVTGIIKTFKLLTIYGSGDPKSLGGGISEALITTELGLFVAIPAVVCHGLLNKWAKNKANDFETDSMALLNGIQRSKSI
ncbi:MAG: MotA/TolQ/ExbB proton channel family protein [Verrucomicrobiota bacterium]